MHIVSQLANHEFLRMEDVLSYNVVDVYAYLQYQDAKVRAENAQMKFTQEMNKRKKLKQRTSPKLQDCLSNYG